MTVPVIYLDEHEANKVAGMLGEISSLEEQKEDLEKKKAQTSQELNSYVTDLFDRKSDVYKELRERFDLMGKPLGSLPLPSISNDKRSLVLLPDEEDKDGPISIVYLDNEESKKIAGLMGEIRSLGEQAGLTSQCAGIKDRDLKEYAKAIAEERSELYQRYRKELVSKHPARCGDVRPILTDDGKAIVIRQFKSKPGSSY